MTSDLKGPDFIGIGLERAGTSWLFTQIAAHPDIWVPPLKELHFFDVLDPQAFYLKHRYRYHLKSRIKQKAAHFIEVSTRPEFYKNSPLTYLLWDYYYFTGRFDLEWYKRLFQPRFTGGRVCGEITPAYSNLSASSIQTILRLNPLIKFLLMVRHPRDRLWSGIVHHFHHLEKRAIETVSELEMLDFVEHSVAQKRSDLLSILETWQENVPKEQLFLRPFEMIARQPEDLIRQTYDYLGVRSDFLPPPALYRQKINHYTKKDVTIPERVRMRLNAICTPVCEEVSRRYPDLVAHWFSQPADVSEQLKTGHN
jgi:hypothetical protein